MYSKQKKLSKISKEYKFTIFIAIFFLIILVRLFYLQVVQADYYQKLLYSQHFRVINLQAERWNIYIQNSDGNSIPLTENIRLYNLYADPKFIKNSNKVADLLTPLIYKHLCVENGINKISSIEECITNIERYTNTKILPEEKTIFINSWDKQYLILNIKEYEKQKRDIIQSWWTWKAYPLIKNVLIKKLSSWIKPYNYLGFFDNWELIKELKKLPFVRIEKNYYVFLIPSKSINKSEDAQHLKNILDNYWFIITYEKIYNNLLPQEKRYEILAKNINAQLMLEIKKLKEKYYKERIEGIPLLHWIWFEEKRWRYYPLGNFASHIIWYLDKNGKAFYGIEQYYDYLLRWKDWIIKWASTPWIWTIGSNQVEIKKPVNGVDIYLTIDFILQKKLEELLQKYQKEFKADSISAIIMDPHSGKIKAMANYPNFDPNAYFKEYNIQPLTEKYKYLIEDDTYVDIPILIQSWDNIKIATYDQRKDPKYKKYIFKNLLGPQVFVDKNISFPYEPWSVFKTFTLAIWLDSDSISLYEYYYDKWFVKVWPYKIKNVAKECLWTHTFLYALERSCNVWMIRIVQKIWKFVFYNYLERLWFGEKTWIQLAWEEAGNIDGLINFSKARFFNNSFWQWLKVTPIQLAVWYSAMVNGGYLIQPTIVEKIYYPDTKQYQYFSTKIKDRIFKPQVSEQIKLALYKVIYEWDLPRLKIEWYTIWWKTWTSQIPFKWKYQKWNWWTNGSFVWIVTKDNLKYVIVIQVRRPRTCQWWACTAWKIFKDLAQFIIDYEGIEK